MPRNGLEVNITKSQVVAISREKEKPSINVNITGETLKQTTKLEHLITDAKCETEINRRIGMDICTFKENKYSYIETTIEDEDAKYTLYFSVV